MAFSGNPRFSGYWVRSADVAAGTASSAGLNVPANTFVKQVIFDVTTAFTTGGYLQVGDDSDADGWITSTGSLLSDGTTMIRIDTGGAAYAAAGGKGYTSADVIDIHLTDSTSGSLFIAAEFIPLGDMD